MMSFKSLVAAALLWGSFANATREFYLRCITDENVSGSCGHVASGMLAMMTTCVAVASDDDMIGELTLVDPFHEGIRRGRNLRDGGEPEAPEQEQEQTSRELGYSCSDSNLSDSEEMMCCLYDNNRWNYCGSPRGRRRLNGVDAEDIEEYLEDVDDECTEHIQDWAKQLIDNGDYCLGTDDEKAECKAILI